MTRSKQFTNKNILVVAAHPDDEVLGCAGTLALSAQYGCKVQVVFMADGCGARDGVLVDYEQSLMNRKQAAIDASKCLQIEPPIFYSFPDNRLDSVPLLDLIKPIESVIQSFKPDVVLTHYMNDLNIDHSLVGRAVLTATRPQPGDMVEAVYAFEVLSSTEWFFGDADPFKPNVYVDITGFMENKLDALNKYAEELRQFPHPRSSEAVVALASLRGSAVGVSAAEAFHLLRSRVECL